MRNDPMLLSLLCCPACQGDVALQETAEIAPDGHIMDGKLRCTTCSAVYPILRGVPWFAPHALAGEVAETVEGFGYQWTQVNTAVQDTLFTSAETFLDFIHPIQPDHFQGKVVLDGGCGLGRFTRWAQAFGATAIIGIDLSRSVDVAFQKLRQHPNVLIVQGDLLALPLKPQFDYAFSIGVLHHTANPFGSFSSIVSKLKPDGSMSAWVYGRENNGWIIYILNPIRRHLTSRLPRPLLWAIAYLLTVPLFLLSKLVYRPLNRFSFWRNHLFYFDYIYFLSRFSFAEQALIVFDHLVPTIAEYIPYNDFRQWFVHNRLEKIVITPRSNNSWRGFGIKAS